MDQICENCNSFRPRKCFRADGICYVVPSKPLFTKKTGKCPFWKQRKETIYERFKRDCDGYSHKKS